MTQMLMPTCVQKLNAFDSGKPVENLLIRGLTHNLRCLLGKGGVAAPIKKKTRSLLSGRRRGGSFQPPIYRKLNEPPRPRFSKERGRLLDGAATPPLPRRGVPFGCFATFIEKSAHPEFLEVRRSEIERRARESRPDRVEELRGKDVGFLRANDLAAE